MSVKWIFQYPVTSLLMVPPLMKLSEGRRMQMDISTVNKESYVPKQANKKHRMSPLRDSRAGDPSCLHPQFPIHLHCSTALLRPRLDAFVHRSGDYMQLALDRHWHEDFKFIFAECASLRLRILQFWAMSRFVFPILTLQIFLFNSQKNSPPHCSGDSEPTKYSL